MYKTVVIKYTPRAKNMAKKIEEKANEMLEKGFELVCFSETPTPSAILVFKEIK